MGKMKHIVAIIIVLTVLIGGFVYLLPRLSELPLFNGIKGFKQTTADTTAIEASFQDTLTFEERMQRALDPLEVSYSKRKKRHIWTMGGGETVITYLLQMQRFVKKAGGKMLYMEELYNNNEVFQAARVDILKDNGDSLNIEIQVSRNEFKLGASLLAVAFQVTQLTPELVAALKKLEYPYDLLIPPFGLSDEEYRFLDKIYNRNITLWLTLESTKLNKAHNKLRPLRIHHTEEQIEAVIGDASSKFPEARGIVSRYGEQAVEHRQLLQAILKPAKDRALWFMDISANKRSIVPQICKELGMTCKDAIAYNPENSSLDDYTKAKIREAKRNGLAVMILPLTVSTVDKLSDLPTKVKSQGTTLINLSTFMKK
ncbi:MAG: divergent polysaccharide deacetylase family protein [Fibrobacter sp.]|nr:divergent polysaccharide deacetylase family protein [Fibrobacter sp.]